ncbi:hypothetical protein SESBI_50333, partial [Sesbania bispinosa]
FIKTRFSPTTDMQLTMDQVHMAVYAFHTSSDYSETIFKVGQIFGTIAMFNTLCPERNVSQQILSMVAAKNNWVQQHSSAPTYWCLPPSFAIDIAEGKTLEEMIKTYAKDWMHAYDDLRYEKINLMGD